MANTIVLKMSETIAGKLRARERDSETERKGGKIERERARGGWRGEEAEKTNFSDMTKRRQTCHTVEC